VRDLQRRLGAAGFQPAGIDPGVFGVATVAALRAFQAVRGIAVTGECDEHTWQALVEAGWELGDRHLYLRSPNLRGDDVGELQQRLGVLGFDAGRIDGIFGPDTHRALSEFQRNVGLDPDGVCGHGTFRALQQLSPRTSDGRGIAAIREQESLKTATGAVHRARVVVGNTTASSILARHVARSLRTHGAQVISSDHPDLSRQAGEANRYDARVYVGLFTTDPACIAYYGVPEFESIGGRQIATLAVNALRAVGITLPAAKPMRLPVLRETRMPAVVMHLGVVAAAQVPAAADAIAEAISSWLSGSA
jgi:N-acetylmuramoyl-L-alanine amidase